MIINNFKSLHFNNLAEAFVQSDFSPQLPTTSATTRIKTGDKERGWEMKKEEKDKCF